MQVVIPMSGFGERFRKVGYDVPKPLIQVDGVPIIEYVVKMFPKECDFIFICNQDHLDEPSYRMVDILNEIAPSGRIVGIPPHKLGPVHAVLQAVKYIAMDQPVIINYADFTCDWDYDNFCSMLDESDCDGAIPCYRGFHPHTLWSNYYAYVKHENLIASDIQEKQPFTDNPRDEFASSGTYYFKNGSLMNRYLRKCVDDGLMVGDEFYVSMAYRPMINDQLRVQIFELQHFMQWGTPADLEEYAYWSAAFRAMLKFKPVVSHPGAVLLPMAGLGSRFSKEGYNYPKPLIAVSGIPMAVQALRCLPSSDSVQLVVRDDLDRLDALLGSFDQLKIKSSAVVLDHQTDGQASTCVEGSDGLDPDLPITIAACDNGLTYNADNFESLFEDDDVDVIVWGARGYPGAIRSPEMYGWIDVDSKGWLRKVSVKASLENPEKDPIIVGAFTFKRLRDFLTSVDSMKKNKDRVNGEYYVDMAINYAIEMGLRCKHFEVDHYICWGTPNDLRTFEYWQTCFDQWEFHPYQLNNDPSYAST